MYCTVVLNNNRWQGNLERCRQRRWRVPKEPSAIGSSIFSANQIQLKDKYNVIYKQTYSPDKLLDCFRQNRCHTKVTITSSLQAPPNYPAISKRIPGIPILPTLLARAQETDNLCQLQYPKYLSNICSDVFSSPSRTRLSYLIDSTQEYKEVL